MAVVLTSEEKIAVAETHLKNVLYNKYNAELSLLEENALDNPSADNITTHNASIAKANAQIAALEAEISALK